VFLQRSTQTPQKSKVLKSRKKTTMEPGAAALANRGTSRLGQQPGVRAQLLGAETGPGRTNRWLLLLRKLETKAQHRAVDLT
jgi:hypothetical protein